MLNSPLLRSAVATYCQWAENLRSSQSEAWDDSVTPDQRTARRFFIREYASGIDARQFPYFCSSTGELGESLRYVIRATVRDWRAFRIIHCWHYTRNWQ